MESRASSRRRCWVGLLAALLAVALGGCATPRRDVPRTASTAFDQPEQTQLGAALQRQLADAGGRSGFHLVESGLQALSLRAGLAELSQRSLDLQYYALHDDTTTTLLMARILRAAHRGVRVRLLIDDSDTAGRDFDLATLAAHPLIDVRVFNPFSWRDNGVSRVVEFFSDASRLNRRMHNKLWIADNAAAIVGGRNLGDAYFEADEALNFSDLDLLAVGPVVRELSGGFDAFWNSKVSVPIEAFVSEAPTTQALATFEAGLLARLQGFRDTDYARALREIRLARQLIAGQVPLVAADAVALQDSPAKALGGDAPAPPGSNLTDQLRPRVEAAAREVILISPYFIPSERGIAVLSSLARRGVRVRVLTNSLASTDVPAVHAAYAAHRPGLLAAGVELHEMRPEASAGLRALWRAGSSSGASLHAKALLIDRRHAVIGSMNLDPRSRLHNTEVAVLLDSATLGARLGDLFDDAVQPARAYQVLTAAPGNDPQALRWRAERDGAPLEVDSEPASWWRRWLSRLTASFLPDDWL
jgi:cardiolipin synthase C